MSDKGWEPGNPRITSKVPAAVTLGQSVYFTSHGTPVFLSGNFVWAIGCNVNVANLTNHNFPATAFHVKWNQLYAVLIHTYLVPVSQLQDTMRMLASETVQSLMRINLGGQTENLGSLPRKEFHVTTCTWNNYGHTTNLPTPRIRTVLSYGNSGSNHPHSSISTDYRILLTYTDLLTEQTMITADCTNCSFLLPETESVALAS